MSEKIPSDEAFKMVEVAPKDLTENKKSQHMENKLIKNELPSTLRGMSYVLLVTESIHSLFYFYIS